MHQDARELLSKAGLLAMIDKFEAQHLYSVSHLQQLSSDDLKELGVSIGQRKTLLSLFGEHVDAGSWLVRGELGSMLVGHRGFVFCVFC